jgi:hypothetical protein
MGAGLQTPTISKELPSEAPAKGNGQVAQEKTGTDRRLSYPIRA